MAFPICGDWPLAEDVVQTALLRLYRQWHRLEPEGLEAYARRVVARLALGEAKHRHRRFEVLGDLPDRPSAAADADAEEVLDVRAALRRVPPRQRAVLVLRFYCDLSVSQTATVLRISEGTVKSQSARGLDALRAHLGAPAPSTVRKD